MSKMIFRDNIGNTKIKSVKTGSTKFCSSPINQSNQTFDYYISTTGNDANPGTLGSPWAITALWTKASTYAGKRLGILDGTYSGYNGSNYNGNETAHLIPAAAAGTSTTRTVVGAVNPRGAVLTGAGGTQGSPDTRARIGLVVDAAYVTVQELEVKEVVYFGIQVLAGNVYLIGNHCHDVSRVAYSNSSVDNTAAISLGLNSANSIISHNYCHDVVTGDGTHESGVLMYHGINVIVEYNEISDAEAGVQAKDDCSGSIIRYNYIYNTTRPLFYGANNAFPVTWNGNVVEGWTENAYSRDNWDEPAGTAFFNNTFVVTTNCAAGVLIRGSGNSVNYYNNLIARSGGSSTSYGDMNATGNTTFALSDYNLYGSTVTFHSPAGTPRTFSAYKTQIGSLDAHSLNSAPTFVGGGSGPYQWKLSGGSAGENAGSSDGTTGGTAVNVGAFRSSGQTEQIGPNWRWPA